jgi:hypothetical protein
MSAPVTNQAYSQQVNQAFDMLKYATPQQMQIVSQQVQQNPNSPEALAMAMAAQFQQQARAPHPQAPQQTVLQQKLQEFQQTSPQGLPSVGGNQMAMQQVDPMRGAGIGVAPENTPAPQQAATGGLVALARGGEVRRFDGTAGSYTGDPLAGLKNLNIDPNDPNLETKYNEEAAAGDVAVANEALGGTPDASSLQYGDNKYAKDRAIATHKNLLSEAKTKKQAPSEKGIASLPGGIYVPSDISKLSEYLTPKGSKVDPNSYDADAIVANMLNKDTTPKYSEQPIGKHDILFAPADTSSAARNEAAPTAYEEKEAIKAFRGPEADMSEEVAMAKEAARSANKDKWGTALAQGLGGMLSAQTPYMSQALGAGLLSGVSGYQSGAKEEQAANKDLMALQMAQKKALMTGDREAADLYLAQKNAEKTAAAAAAAKLAELKYGKDVELQKEQMGNKSAKEIAQMNADNNYIVAQMKAQYEGTPNGAQLLTASMAALKQINENPTTMSLPPEEKMALARKYVSSGASNPMVSIGNIGGGSSAGQAVGNRGITLIP